MTITGAIDRYPAAPLGFLFVHIAASLLFIGWAALVFVDDRVKVYWSPLNWPLLGLFAIGLGQLLLRHHLHQVGEQHHD